MQRLVFACVIRMVIVCELQVGEVEMVLFGVLDGSAVAGVLAKVLNAASVRYAFSMRLLDALS